MLPTRRGSVRKGAVMRASRFAIAILLAAAPVTAGAVPKAPTEAELLFGRGVEAFEAGRYEAAAVFLSQAYALEPEARLAFNTALAYQRAGKTTEAVTWYRLAAAADEPSLRAEAEAAIARLVKGGSQPEARVSPERVAEATLSLRLERAVAGASVKVDGGNALALPGTVRVAPGAHLIEASAPERQPWQETVTVEAGESRVVSIVLVPVMAADGFPRWWIGSGLTAAAAAAGVGYYFVSAGHFDEADRLAQGGVDRVGFDREQADGRTAATLSNASYGVAAASALATGLIWWLDRDRSPVPGEVSLVPVLGPTQAGLMGSWRP